MIIRTNKSIHSYLPTQWDTNYILNAVGVPNIKCETHDLAVRVSPGFHFGKPLKHYSLSFSGRKYQRKKLNKLEHWLQEATNNYNAMPTYGDSNKLMKHKLLFSQTEFALTCIKVE